MASMDDLPQRIAEEKHQMWLEGARSFQKYLVARIREAQHLRLDKQLSLLLTMKPDHVNSIKEASVVITTTTALRRPPSSLAPVFPRIPSEILLRATSQQISGRKILKARPRSIQLTAKKVGPKPKNPWEFIDLTTGIQSTENDQISGVPKTPAQESSIAMSMAQEGFKFSVDTTEEDASKAPANGQDAQSQAAKSASLHEDAPKFSSSPAVGNNVSAMNLFPPDRMTTKNMAQGVGSMHTSGVSYPAKSTANTPDVSKACGVAPMPASIAHGQPPNALIAKSAVGTSQPASQTFRFHPPVDFDNSSSVAMSTNAAFVGNSSWTRRAAVQVHLLRAMLDSAPVNPANPSGSHLPQL